MTMSVAAWDILKTELGKSSNCFHTPSRVIELIHQNKCPAGKRHISQNLCCRRTLYNSSTTAVLVPGITFDQVMPTEWKSNLGTEFDAPIIEKIAICGLNMAQKGYSDDRTLKLQTLKDLLLNFDASINQEKRLSYIRKTSSLIQNWSSEGQLIALELLSLAYFYLKDLESGYLLAILYIKGIPKYMKPNARAAASIWNGLATSTDPAAHYFLGVLYFSRDKKRSRKHLSYACKNGYPRAFAKMGELELAEGHEARALELMEKAKKLGAAVNLMTMAEISKEPRLQYRYLKQAANSGSAYASYKLGRLLLSKIDFVTDGPDYKQALMYFEKALSLDFNPAAYELGRIYSEGATDVLGNVVVEKNLRTSMRYLDKLSFSLFRRFKDFHYRRELKHFSEESWAQFVDDFEALYKKVRVGLRDEHGLCLIQ